QISTVINVADFSNLFVKLLGATTTVFIGFFSVLFLSFFFLRDRHLLRSGILLFAPDRFQPEVKTILHKTKLMLSRYFIGLLSQLFIMMILLTIGLSVFGIKNAILIGFFGGFMNVIPYLGPIIGATIGTVLGMSSDLGLGLYDNAFNSGITVILVFATANLIDNFVIQPLIFSNRVNAHPIEILLVILMAGSLAGIPGMILAIPGYTVLRIVAKEFLSGFKLIDKLTENI
ncbi:MAG: AI-2E family transporter, partial [Bacteroidales bacterium]|nr:AI-2E family transporter [Bacteroidales bacterium]